MLNCSNRFTLREITQTHTHIQVKCLNVSYRRVCCAQQIECVYAFTVPSSDLKILEAKDVQDTDWFEVLFPFDLLIDFADDPGEALCVQRHGNRVPGIHRLWRGEGKVIVTVEAGKQTLWGLKKMWFGLRTQQKGVLLSPWWRPTPTLGYEHYNKQCCIWNAPHTGALCCWCTGSLTLSRTRSSKSKSKSNPHTPHHPYKCTRSVTFFRTPQSITA